MAILDARSISVEANIVSTSSQELNGQPIPLLYSDEDLKRTTAKHREIVLSSPDSPYFNFTSSGEPMTFQMELGPVKVDAGPIGAFSEEVVAAFLNEQIWNYQHQDTMGKGFPKGNVDSENELSRILLNGFSQNDLMIIATFKNQNKIKPVGGARIVHGSSKKLLSESAFNDSSTLPTFQAVVLKDLDPSFDKSVLDLPEDEVVCITRFWGQKREVMEELGINRVSTPADIIALMCPLYVQYANNNDNPVPKLALFDIHHRRVLEFVRSNFAALLVADGEDVAPTNSILNTVLKYHYVSSEIGGYSGSINIGVFQTDEFFKKSASYWQAK